MYVCMYTTMDYAVTDKKTSASARSISRHVAPVDVQNSAIPGAIAPKWEKTCPRSGRTAMMMMMMKLPILPCAEKLELVLSTAMQNFTPSVKPRLRNP